MARATLRYGALIDVRQSEDAEQMTVMRWAELASARWPQLKRLFHIPNGGQRNKATAARFKAMGVKSGVPDLFLPFPCGGYAGLWIELKVGKNKPTAKQIDWLDALQRLGYQTQVCWGAEEAIRTITEYLEDAKQ